MICHQGPISGIDSSDRYVVTAGYDNVLILWDAESGIAVAKAHHDHLVNQCVFDPTGNFVASASSDFTARVWSVPDLRLKGILVDHKDDVEGLSFHPYQPLLATASRDANIRIFDFDGRLIRILSGHKADVLTVTWVEDGKKLVSSSDDGTVKYWDFASGQLISELFTGNTELDAIAVDSDLQIYLGTDGGEIIILNSSEREHVRAHASGIKRLALSSDQSTLLSQSYDQTCKLWSVKPFFVCRHKVELPDSIWPRSAAFLGENKLVFGTFGCTYGTYDIPGQNWQLDQSVDNHGINAVSEYKGHVYTIGDAGVLRRDRESIARLSGPGNFLIEYQGRLLSGGHNGRLFDVISGEIFYQHCSPLNCATIFYMGGIEKLMIGTYGGQVLIMETSDTDAPSHTMTLQIHNNAIKGIAANTNTIFSVCADGAAAFYDGDSLARIEFFADAHDRIANDCDALEEANFVSVGRDLKLRIWNRADATVLSTPSNNSIKSVAVSYNQRFIAIGSYTGYIGIYELSSAEWIMWKRPTTAGISCIKSYKDDKFLCSTYDGGVWQIDASTTALSNLEEDNLGGKAKAPLGHSAIQ